MKCEDIREQLLDLAGAEPAAEQKQNLAACAACAAKLAELQKTMALLDEWKAPEVSPYFDGRLTARLRAEKVAAPRGVFGWLRSPVFLRPAAAAVFTILVAAGVGLYQYGDPEQVEKGTNNPVATVKASEGSAVADLQALDKNEEMLAEFDLLDDLAAQQQQR